MKTWLITGCSTGLRRVLAEEVVARGDCLLATARNIHAVSDLVQRYPDKVHAITLDVTKNGDVAKAIDTVSRSFGGLDVLVNNAGYGLMGAIEEATPDEYRPMFDTNVFGMIETVRAALPLLRGSGRGRIVNLSSVAGIAGRAGVGYYNATKFAVEGLSEALAQEVEPFGIRVIIATPGRIRTDFLGRSLQTTKNTLPAYAQAADKNTDHRSANNGRQNGDPRKIARVIMTAVDAEAPPLHLAIGRDCYDRIRAKFAAFEAEMLTWEHIATATNFGDDLMSMN